MHRNEGDQGACDDWRQTIQISVARGQGSYTVVVGEEFDEKGWSTVGSSKGQGESEWKVDGSRDIERKSLWNQHASKEREYGGLRRIGS